MTIARPTGSADRQAVIPARLLKSLDVKTGDVLEVVRRGEDVLLSIRRSAPESLAAIRAAFEAAGVTEEELLADVRDTRLQLAREKYGLDPEA